ncbi:hypothetical protein OS493_003632 [Desmophyllum pertusum]|uniref:G-protein coupled receptor GRL101 n=1 Tax=Desmophyllum pertusum TaxID=174260 RepID=A0A9X0A5U0_9CNID|nr:hypothetical protein OS493_003632 [Desmophyllum pertusum]
MKAIDRYVLWFVLHLFWNKAFTNTISYGRSPPTACLISLNGMAGTFGDTLTMQQPPSTRPSVSTVPTMRTMTTRMTTAMTTRMTSPTTPSTSTASCIEYKQWKITVPKGHYIEMTLESINLGPLACRYDKYVIIKDGNLTSSNVLRIQCEPDAVPRNISSSGTEMLVERYSNSYRLSANTGFKARYKAKLLTDGEAPSFQSLLESVTVLYGSYYGQASQLLCQAQGAPAPEITWYNKDNKVLQNSSTSVLYKMPRYPRKGEYVCEATNSFGSKQRKRFLVKTESCSRACRCLVQKSHPFWFGVFCTIYYPYTVPKDLPYAAKYLEFYGNLWHITPRSFKNLTNLQYLLLQNTRLVYLTKNALQGLKQLKFLEITEQSKGRQFKILNGTFNDLSSLEYMTLRDNVNTYLASDVFKGLLSLRELILSRNYLSQISMEINNLEKTLSILDEKSFRGSGSSLKFLDLRGNKLKTISKDTFQTFSSLRELYLSNNELSELPTGIFQDLTDLIKLDLFQNKITQLPGYIFDKLNKLETLDLSENEISELPQFIFKELKSLKTLYLNNNKITDILPNAFAGLKNLENLNLQGNLLKDMPIETFRGLWRLRNLKVDSFSLCCYATLYVYLKCDYPKLEGSALSSCNRMIEAPGPRQSIWLLGILAVFGNLAVIAWRLIRRDDHPVQTCLLTNLAVSDFLMGIYLMIIAIKDQLWAGAYFSFDLTWRSGALCKVAGILSVMSSEVSVLMLTVITADRLISIVFAFSCSRLTLRGTYVICTVVWICGTIIAVIPAIDTPFFYNEDRRYGFYGRSSVCLPLQLSPERLAGWEYSVGVFIGLNLAAFLFIIVAYIAIIVKVSRSQRRVKAHGESDVSSNSMKRESALARRVSAIILTDFSCWIPVIILSILSLTGQFHDEQGFVYVWFAVFVLPVNSSVNPVLYTFSTPKVRSVLKGWFYRLFRRLSCKNRSASNNISGTGNDDSTTQQETVDRNTIHMDVSVTQPPNDGLQQNRNIAN